VPMHPDGVEKTSFRTHQGLFEFMVMLFGITNVSTTFEALMNRGTVAIPSAFHLGILR
jgi:hypothetical protein